MKSKSSLSMRLIYVSILITLIACPILSIAQSNTPLLWFRADTPGHDSGWVNCADTNQILYNTVADLPETSLMNYNTVFHVEDSIGGFLLNVDTMLEFTTVYMVYQDAPGSDEHALWRLDLNSDRRIELTSQHLIQGGSDITYSDSSFAGPKISASFLGWKKVDKDSTGIWLSIAGTDSLDMNGDIAEFLLFGEKLNPIDDAIYQSYLAIKYGVTLVNSSYLNSAGDTIWDYDKAGNYTDQVAGLGRDTVLELHQKQSRNYSDIITLSLGAIQESNDDNLQTITPGEYLLWSNDGQGLGTQNVAYLNDTSVNSILYQSWMVQPFNCATALLNTTMRIDISKVDCDDPENAILLWDTSGNGQFDDPGMIYIYPDSLENDSIVSFSGMHWDPDNNGRDVFTLAVKKEDDTKNQQTSQGYSNPYSNSSNNENRSEQLLINDKECSFKLYPNPSEGEYHLEVLLKESREVVVEVFDINGKFFDRYEQAGSDRYHFSKKLDIPGLYQLRVTVGEHQEFLHLIVK